MSLGYQMRHMSQLQQASNSGLILGIRLSSMQGQTRVRAGFEDYCTNFYAIPSPHLPLPQR